MSPKNQAKYDKYMARKAAKVVNTTYLPKGHQVNTLDIGGIKVQCVTNPGGTIDMKMVNAMMKSSKEYAAEAVASGMTNVQKVWNMAADMMGLLCSVTDYAMGAQAHSTFSKTFYQRKVGQTFSTIDGDFIIGEDTLPVINQVCEMVVSTNNRVARGLGQKSEMNDLWNLFIKNSGQSR